MSSARSELLSRIAVLRDCLNEQAANDGAPHESKKNAVASMIRSGLTVMAFSITEAFIRDRTSEILNNFSSAHVSFGDLSENLQKAITISALEGLLFRVKFQEKSNRIAWALSQLPPIANAGTNLSKLSGLSFGQSSSNLADDDLTDILKAFGVNGGWTSVSALAKRIGLGGVLDCAQAFKDLSKRRHSAAHDVTAHIPLNDLKDSLDAILAICCPFDLLLTHALAQHNLRKFPNKSAAIQPTDVKLRVISPHPSKLGKFREQTEATASAKRHTVKIHATSADALNAALLNARTRGESVLFLGSNGIPESWVAIP